MYTTVKTAFGLLVTVGLCASAPAVGQVRSPTGFETQGLTQSQTPTRTPTQEQLRMLQQLPENQRRELMRALGITDLDLQRMGQQELQFPETVRPPLPELEEEEEWPPKLEAGSTVIVKLQLPRLTDPAEGFQQQQQQQQQQLQQQQPRTQRPIRVDPSRRPTDEDLQDLQDFSRLETQGDVDPELERRFQERVERHPQLGRVRGAITYVLDRQGRINFPGIATIPLAGLTEYQAARRIEA